MRGLWAEAKEGGDICKWFLDEPCATEALGSPSVATKNIFVSAKVTRKELVCPFGAPSTVVAAQWQGAHSVLEGCNGPAQNDGFNTQGTVGNYAH